MRWRGAAAVVLILLVICGVGAIVASGRNPKSVPAFQARRGLGTQFGASSKFIVYPVILPGEVTGLIWIDRSTHTKKLIRMAGAGLYSPFISRDNERLLFVRSIDGSVAREIIRCSIGSWRCERLFKVDMSVRSPIEVESGNVLFSASELTGNPSEQNRHEVFDFFYFDVGASVVTKLTEFKFSSLNSLQYVEPRIYFTALRFVIGDQDSQAYSLEFDDRGRRFVESPPLQPIRFPDFRPSYPACSDSCALMAFLSLGANGFDLVISQSGAISEVVKPRAWDRSRPRVVDDTVVINELFENEDVVTAYRLSQPSEVLERLPSSPKELDKLQSISLSVDK